MVMKNLHLIPTLKPSRLYKSKITQNISMGPIDIYQHGDATYNLNIYITSDEEIKEGDWVYHCASNKLFKYDGRGLCVEVEKIILTTDQDLIKDGVQDIDTEFLKWFVKNPSCESVAVKQELGVCLNCEWNYDSCPNTEECLKDNYKIIIPQEEPNKTHHLDELPNMDKDVVLKMYNAAIPKLESKQETLEESIERLVKLNRQDAFIEGAKWQAERMYSEEEVIDLLQEMNDWPTIFDGRIDIKEWFEKFKKK
jgi:hypothetical protein